MEMYLTKYNIILSQTKVLLDEYSWFQPNSKTAEIKNQANLPKSSN